MFEIERRLRANVYPSRNLTKRTSVARSWRPGPMSTTVLLWAAAAILLFEEWFWARSTRAIAKLARVAHLSAAESWIRRRRPWQALALFGLPILVVYPCKVLALVALAQGSLVLGATAFVAAKLFATAVFACVRGTRKKFLQARAFVHAWLDARPAYRRARALLRRRTAHLSHRYRVAYRLHSRRRQVASSALPWRNVVIKADASSRPFTRARVRDR
jgi:hypothetical protein